MITFSFILSAFVAGIFMFLAPCTLPLVPAYLGFISGVDTKDLENPETALRARKIILKNGISFIVGFSVVFILFGTLAGLFGQAIAPFRIWLTRIGGALVILFGLYMLGLFTIPLFKQGTHLKIPTWLTPGKPLSSLGIGATFAFGWTPCIGPILGSILLLASSSATAFEGALLLGVFSFGLAIPFLVLTIAFSKATHLIERSSGVLQWISRIGGVFLVVLGLLLLTDNFGLTIQYGYQLFDFIDYERILNFL